MNLRQFSIAFLISALPMGAIADPDISLNKGDFIAAESLNRDGESIVSVKLSKSGKAKFKKLNDRKEKVEIKSDIAGVSTHFKMKEPITGDELEMGPYSEADANRVIKEINNN